jgi:hypothetical protein
MQEIILIFITMWQILLGMQLYTCNSDFGIMIILIAIFNYNTHIYR